MLQRVWTKRTLIHSFLSSPLLGQDVRRHGPLAGPPALTDREQDRPRGANVRLRQRRADLQHRQCCQDLLIVRASLLSA